MHATSRYRRVGSRHPRRAGRRAALFYEYARRLNRAGCALLAAVLPNPRRLRNEAPSAYVCARGEWNAQQMQDLGGTAYLNPVKEDLARHP
jgi:hypothetical protein